jgi:putative ABC transport system permease protein
MIASPPPLRQWLYVLNLAVGMMLFVCAFSFMGAVSRSITQGLDRLGSDVIVVSKPDLPFASSDTQGALDRADVERLRAAIGAGFEVSAVSRAVLPVQSGGQEAFATVWQVEPSFFDAAGLEITEGRRFTDYEASGRADLCLVSAEIASAVGAKQQGGAPLNLLIGGRSCLVIGTVSSAETLPNFSVAQAVYVPFASAENPQEGAPVSQIFLRSRAGPPGADAAQAVRAALPGEKIDIWLAREFWALRSAVANSLWLLVLLMSSVVLGMAALGLSNSLSLEVLQRRGEIGLRIALGATRRDIFRMFLIQGLTVVALGGVLGTGAGALIVQLVLGPLVGDSDLLTGTGVTLDGGTILAALLVLAATSVLACIVPARRAVKVDPSLAVRSL